MHGDFSRDTFDATRHFSRVLFQQGRVVLDADPNEQASILLHYLRTLAQDIIGPHGMVGKAAGFAIAVKDGDLTIGPGHYYVDGILCENDEPEMTYSDQRDLPGAETDDLEGFPFLAYLDVWERFVPSWAKDGIREVALGSIDTAARARVVWQVKVARFAPLTTCGALGDSWTDRVRPANRGHLRARIAPREQVEDPCKAEAGAAYRGVENQLYRVEIHHGSEGGPTFKWARDNGSIVFSIGTLSKDEATLESLGEDATRSLRIGDWVEVLDDVLTLRGKPGIMARVVKVNPLAKKVTLEPAGEPSPTLPQYDARSTSNPLLRRWDHHGEVAEDGARAITESDSLTTGWHELEDDLEVQFIPSDNPSPSYRTGDYWLIPARTAIAGIEWPQEPGIEGDSIPLAVPPHGIEHHYAPLAVVSDAGVESCRRCLSFATLFGNCS